MSGTISKDNGEVRSLTESVSRLDHLCLDFEFTNPANK